jgi:hypothetical protein
VHHVDQIVADREHVPPRSQVSLESGIGVDDEAQLRACRGDRLVGDRREGHADVLGRLWRVVAIELKSNRV